MAAAAAVKAVGVLGAGQMGSGIAQLAAAAGRRVVLQVRAPGPPPGASANGEG